MVRSSSIIGYVGRLGALDAAISQGSCLGTSRLQRRGGVTTPPTNGEDAEEPTSEAQEAGPIIVARPATERRQSTRARIPSTRTTGP
jgi:hypothetical protein